MNYVNLKGVSQLVNPENVRDDLDIEQLERDIVDGKIQEAPVTDIEDDLNAIMRELNELHVATSALPNGGNYVSYESKPIYFDTPPVNPRTVQPSVRPPSPRFDDSMNPYKAEQTRIPFGVGGNAVPRPFQQQPYQSQSIYNQAANSYYQNNLRAQSNYAMNQSLRFKKLKSIEDLKRELKSEGVRIDYIPEVGTHSSIEEIEEVESVLSSMYGELTSRTIGTEVIMLGIGILEKLLDGEKTYFGFRPDLRGYSRTARLRLESMGYDIGCVTQDVTQSLGIDKGGKILASLIPGMITYSASKNQQAGRKNYIPSSKLMEARIELDKFN